MVNDLSRGTCPAVEIKCLVIDEAHKALGNHAYCQVILESPHSCLTITKKLPQNHLQDLHKVSLSSLLSFRSLALFERDQTVLCVISAFFLSKTW